MLGPVVALLAAAAGACRADAPAPAPAPPQRVYVSNETAGTIAVIDPATGSVLATIPVGKRPRGLRLSRDGKQLYVALSGSPIAPPGVDESTLPPADRAADGIAVVDIATRKMVRTIHSGQDPEAFDLSPDGRWLYVSNEETAEMSVVDVAAGKVALRVPVGDEPEGVTVSPDGKVVYVTCEDDHTVVAVDTTSLAPLGRVIVGLRPRSIAITPDGETLFVTDENSSSISVVNAARRTPRRDDPAAQARRRPDAAPADGRGAVAGREAAVRVERPGQVGVGHRRRRSGVSCGRSTTSVSGRGALASTPTAPSCTPPTVLPATCRSSTSPPAPSSVASASAAVPGAIAVASAP